MEKTEIIRETISKIFGFLNIEPNITIENINGRTRANVSTAEAGFLIGRDGENLRSFQHIVSLLVAKKTGDFSVFSSFVFDINNYQKEKEDYLIALVKNSAAKVLETGQIVELEAMSAFERKIVHITIEQIDGVKSESIGDGEDRRVIISPRA
ncbi:MAG: R3H domain-containing nucleic acid-binding protein [bacterium]|nr:R3H domain-containing nucleic acid-binding protein [bacterium]